MSVCTTRTHQHPLPSPPFTTETSTRHHRYTCRCTFHRSPRPCPSLPHPHHFCGTDLLTAALRPGSTPPLSLPCLPAPAVHAHCLPVRFLLDHLSPDARLTLPSQPLPSHRCSSKATSFPHSSPSVCLPSSPFSVVPNTSASSRSTFTSFSPKPVWALHD